MEKQFIKRLLTQKWILSLILALCSALYILHGHYADAVARCCSRHKGICQCRCCDGTSLSETCRSQVPQCADEVQKRGRKYGDGRKKERLPNAFDATVTKVRDGDTLVVTPTVIPAETGAASIDVPKKSPTVTIRLADIDCPETSQPFGAEATDLTRRLTQHQTLHIKVRATDRYHRTVADVALNSGESLNASLLKAGLAWWYRDYSKNKTLETLEKDARNAKRGLWSQEDPLPPWVYRRNQRKKSNP